MSVPTKLPKHEEMENIQIFIHSALDFVQSFACVYNTCMSGKESAGKER